MFRKVLTIAAVIAAVTAEPPVPHSSAEAVSSQSFTRHDVPLSYKQTAVHPRYVAQTIKSVTAAPIHYGPSQINYVTQSPQYSYSTSQPQHSYSTPSSVQYTTSSPQYASQSVEYSTPVPQYSSQTVQYSNVAPQYSSQSAVYSTPSPQYSSQSVEYSTPSTQQSGPFIKEYSTPAPQYSSQSVRDYAPVQALLTKIKTPTENGPSEEFTQAYFLPKTSTQSSRQQNAQQQIGKVASAPQTLYYVMQPQYSTASVQYQPQAQYQPQVQYQPQAQYQPQIQYQPQAQYQPQVQNQHQVQYQPQVQYQHQVQYQPQVQYQHQVQYQPQVQHYTYQSAQQTPVQYITSADGQGQSAQEYVYPQQQIDEQPLVYRVAVPTSHKVQQLIQYQNKENNRYEPQNAPVIAKFTPADFKSSTSFKSNPIYVQAAPIFSTQTKPTPLYTVSAPAYVKPTLNYVQAATVVSKPVTEYAETTPVVKSAPAYTKPTVQYNVESAPPYGQTMKLYAIPSNAQAYYQQH